MNYDTQLEENLRLRAELVGADVVRVRRDIPTTHTHTSNACMMCSHTHTHTHTHTHVHTYIQKNHDQLKLDYDKLQNSLSEKIAVLERERENNQTLQQLIALLEEEKTHHTEEVAQLMQDKITVEDEKVNVIRENQQLRVSSFFF